MPNLELNKELNLLGPSNFHFEAIEIPKVSLFTQNFTMPGCTLGRAPVFNSNVDYDAPGDKMTFEDLMITFMVDEYLENYTEVFNWMTALGFPESSDQFKEMKENQTPYSEVSDIILTITSNKYNPIRKIVFVDAFPTDLAALQFTSTDPTVTPIICDVTFDYSYFYIKPMNEGA